MRILIFVLLLALPGSASAVNLTCTVPPGAATARGGQLCELLRQSVNVRTADWSNNACATEFLRRGLRNFEASVIRRASEATVRGDVTTALGTFDTNHPRAVNSAICGDGVVDDTDPNLGEECDPPNGTTCDNDCQTIP